MNQKQIILFVILGLIAVVLVYIYSNRDAIACRNQAKQSAQRYMANLADVGSDGAATKSDAYTAYVESCYLEKGILDGA